MNHPTSPEQNVNEGVVRTPKEFSDGLTLDLTDDEIKQAFTLTQQIVSKYAHRRATVEVFDAIDDEVSTRFAEIGVLAKYNRVENFIDIMGKLPGTDFYKYGFDHEKKKFEVERAVNRQEDFYGQRSEADGAAKNRATTDRRKNQDLQQMQDGKAKK